MTTRAGCEAWKSGAGDEDCDLGRWYFGRVSDYANMGVDHGAGCAGVQVRMIDAE